MKKSFLFLFICSMFATTNSHATNFEPGDALTVFATSGLTLRMGPSQHAESVIVIPFGDEVVVLNNFGFAKEKSDRIGWMDGHWVLVDYFGLQGYLFDGFLSTLSVPDHESELCGDCAHIIYPIDQYFDDKYTITHSSEESTGSEIISQYMHVLDSTIVRKRSYTDGWFHVEFQMEDIRLCEVLNLMRSMIVNKNLRQDFENSLVFKTDREGHVYAVDIKLYDNPIRLHKTKDGKLKLSATVVHMTEGC